MFGIAAVLGLGIFAIWKQPSIDEVAADIPQKLSGKLDRLWDIAQESLRERKYLRAEKALLTILRVDERNATAYNRLGILYAKQQAYKDAIECFEIAQSLEPSASSLHNVGLIYFETGDFEKAGLAFEQALAIEHDHAARHIAYAKVQEQLGHTKKMIDSLEKAVRLEPSIQSYNILIDAYDRHGRAEDAATLRARVEKAVTKHNTPARIAQPRKVVM